MGKIMALGEMMMRFSPPGTETLKQHTSLETFYGGAEINVAVALSNLGTEAEVITALPDNPVGDAALAYLRKEGVQTGAVQREGNRLGTYFVEKGTAERPSKITYDRAYSSFSQWSPQETISDSWFQDCQILHISGITLAISREARETAYALAKKAKEHGVQISFDFNYRSKLWSIEQAREAFEYFLPMVDICFAGVKDLTNILNYNVSGDADGEEKAYRAFMQDYGITWLASSRRRPFTNLQHQLSGLLLHASGGRAEAPVYDVSVYDRIGGGDAFSAGILHQILESPEASKNMSEMITFAVAVGVLAHTVPGDAFCLPKEDVNAFLNSQQGSDIAR
ncbi:hypothetical protein CHL76_11285 [Marinococcus halophilus]|uniref:2-dehydro-3-deoxygluconokinase n=1 Tax=Marinococcus halophilus TaxID=1371 RepID=A0A510Y6T0_MARHA|nr:sugar kinase [Marinococcus halophilus]OZT79712.1 hypothetical protein CHL76_11285 [Marinococcus halophilus]GEK59068.1 2-dehydro-3-deoxygluconokinase [Marinococcus halophilus]